MEMWALIVKWYSIWIRMKICECIGNKKRIKALLLLVYHATQLQLQIYCRKFRMHAVILALCDNELVAQQKLAYVSTSCHVKKAN